MPTPKRPAITAAAKPSAARTTVTATGTTRTANTANTATAAARRAPAAGAGAAPVLSRRALNRATLARQLLLRREKVKPVAAIERLLGLQAQIARPPFVALWSRLEGFQREDLIAPIARRDLVRATMMRATIHLFTRRDFFAFRPAIQPVLIAARQAVLKDRAKEIDIDKLLAAARACFDARPCTLDELRKSLVAGPFATLDERAMGYIVKMQLPLIQLPEAAAQWAYPAAANFAVAETWLDEPVKLEDATLAAPHALALRYFAAFGPASIQDFQSFTGLGAMRAAVEELRPKLRTFRDERGRELFDLPKAPRPAEDEAAPVRFLAEFDNVILGYAERARIVDDAHKPALLTKNLLVPAVFLVDGFISGRWSIETKKGVARVLVQPFIALGKAARTALEEEGDRLGRFVEPAAKSHSVDFEKRA